MAGFDNGSQSGGVWQKMQDLLAEHISSLEYAKIEEARVASQQAEEAKMAQKKAEDAVVQAKNGLSVLNVQKDQVETEIIGLHEAKLGTEAELDELNEQIKKQQVLIDNLVSQEKSFLLSFEADKITQQEIIEKRDVLLSQQKSLNVDLSNKQLNLKEIEQKISERESMLRESEQKIQVNESLIQKLSGDNKKLLEEIELAKQLKVESESKKLAEQEQCRLVVAECELRKKVAEEELQAVLKDVENYKNEILESQQKIENEMLFIKQMNDINLQKNKEVAQAKTKLKEIIAKLILEVDEVKASEFKNILFVVDKL